MLLPGADHPVIGWNAIVVSMIETLLKPRRIHINQEG